MAAKLDKVLESLESMQSRINNLESRGRDRSQTRTRNNNRPFTGHCYGCGQQGHIKTRCPLNLKKLLRGWTAGQTSASSQTKVTRLVGQSNEVDHSINNSPTCALLDTGFMVSTIAEIFVHKPKLDVKPW